jgi:hypothetical protein
MGCLPLLFDSSCVVTVGSLGSVKNEMWRSYVVRDECRLSCRGMSYFTLRITWWLKLERCLHMPA